MGKQFYKSELFMTASKEATEATMKLQSPVPDISPETFESLTPPQKLILEVAYLTAEATRMKDTIEVLRTHMHKKLADITSNPPSDIHSETAPAEMKIKLLIEQINLIQHTTKEFKNMAIPLVDGYQRTTKVIEYLNSKLAHLSARKGKKQAAVWEEIKDVKHSLFKDPDRSKIGLAEIVPEEIFDYVDNQKSLKARSGELESELLASRIIDAAATFNPKSAEALKEYTQNVKTQGSSDAFGKIIGDIADSIKKSLSLGNMAVEDTNKLCEQFEERFPKGSKIEEMLLVGANGAGAWEFGAGEFGNNWIVGIASMLMRTYSLLTVLSDLLPLIQLLKDLWGFEWIRTKFGRATENFNWKIFKRIGGIVLAGASFMGVGGLGVLGATLSTLEAMTEAKIKKFGIDVFKALCNLRPPAALYLFMKSISQIKSLGTPTVYLGQMFKELGVTKKLQVNWLSGYLTPTKQGLSSNVAQVFSKYYDAAWAGGSYGMLMMMREFGSYTHYFIAQTALAGITYYMPGLVTSIMGVGTSVVSTVIFVLYSSIALDGINKIIANSIGSEGELARYNSINNKFNFEGSSPTGFWNDPDVKDIVNSVTLLVSPVIKEGFKAMRYGPSLFRTAAEIISNENHAELNDLDAELERWIGVAASIALRDYMRNNRRDWTVLGGFVGLACHILAELLRCLSQLMITGSPSLYTFKDMLPVFEGVNTEELRKDEMAGFQYAVNNNYNCNGLAYMAGFRAYHRITVVDWTTVGEFSTMAAEADNKLSENWVFWFLSNNLKAKYAFTAGILGEAIPWLAAGSLTGSLMIPLITLVCFSPERLTKHLQHLRTTPLMASRGVHAGRRKLGGSPLIHKSNIAFPSAGTVTEAEPSRIMDLWATHIIQSSSQVFTANDFIVVTFVGNQKVPEFSCFRLENVNHAKNLNSSYVTTTTDKTVIKNLFHNDVNVSSFSISKHPVMKYLIEHLCESSKPIKLNTGLGTDLHARPVKEALKFTYTADRQINVTINGVNTAFYASTIKITEIERSFSSLKLNEYIQGLAIYKPVI